MKGERKMLDNNGNSKIKINDESLAAVSGGTGECAGNINISIRDLHGRVYYFTVSPDMTVYDLKLMWTGEELHVPFVRLIYKAKELDNSRTLASYDITDGTLIHLIFGK